MNFIRELLRSLYLAVASRDKPSPGDWVKRSQISYNKDLGVLGVQVQFKPGEHIKIFNVANTKSMDSFMDYSTNVIGSSAFDRAELKAGDDIIFQIYTDLIVHRILRITEDTHGRIYRTRGINNGRADPWLLRDEHIRYVVIGQFN